MKQYRITFSEQEMAQFEALIGEIPTKWGNPLVNMYAQRLQESTIEEPKPKPIGGGGGGPVKPSKNE
jgi:hypothetical protein